MKLLSVISVALFILGSTAFAQSNSASGKAESPADAPVITAEGIDAAAAQEEPASDEPSTEEVEGRLDSSVNALTNATTTRNRDQFSVRRAGVVRSWPGIRRVPGRLHGLPLVLVAVPV